MRAVVVVSEYVGNPQPAKIVCARFGVEASIYKVEVLALACCLKHCLALWLKWFSINIRPVVYFCQLENEPGANLALVHKSTRYSSLVPLDKQP